MLYYSRLGQFQGAFSSSSSASLEGERISSLFEVLIYSEMFFKSFSKIVFFFCNECCCIWPVLFKMNFEMESFTFFQISSAFSSRSYYSYSWPSSILRSVWSRFTQEISYSFFVFLDLDHSFFSSTSVKNSSLIVGFLLSSLYFLIFSFTLSFCAGGFLFFACFSSSSTIWFANSPCNRSIDS